jgi:WD40 repeat protein/serine/threonine protein kinase
MEPADTSEAAIFDAALACASPQERAAYLDKACTGKPELRRRIEGLLAAHDQATGFLENSQAAAARPTVRLALQPEEQPGERIGRYKLLQKIGEGGCGVVYMAEQEEPVRRRVALKIIKLGMDTRQVVARFEAERQALALMDHPNIAKVLDAGATDKGRPFFVMELVKGISVTRYADENKLDTRQRLDLFIQICQAVQHAHQKGIIHRDIKPSNVLVADHDGTPVPKVIDFGIAKATTDQRLTDKTLFTALEQFIGTPAYMSPEQAKLSGLDVDTRSDIYSLGVLLYEMLTGKTPFDARRLLDAGFDEIRRIIREEDPPRPSTRLSTLEAVEQTDVARHRHSEVLKLLGIIRGDLDWIVMKCLEKDRSRRYETANGLARDIQRHLSNEPIVARPPSSVYRFQKLVRRNKLTFAASGAVAAALVLGLGVSLWQAIRVTRSERNERGARLAAEQSRIRESQQRALAEQNARQASESGQSAHRLLYAADTRLAHQAWEDGNLSRMVSLLKAHHPEPGGADSRGFEYFLLQELAKGEQQHVLQSNTNPVFSLAVSPDGKWLASRTQSAIQLWDLAARKPVASWPSPASRDAGAMSGCFSYDSQYLALEAEDGLQLCHVPTLRSRLVATGQVWQATFSPVTNWIAYDYSPARTDGLRVKAGVWDYLAEKEVNAFAASAILCWSPDGARLLTGRWSHQVELWNVTTGKPEPGDFLRATVPVAAFSPNGRLVAAADWQGAVHLVDVMERKTIGTIVSGNVRPSALAFSPDGNLLATGSGDQAIQIWDVAARQLVRKLRGHHGKVTGLAFTPDGRTLVSAGMDGAVMLWNPVGHTGESQIPNALTGFGRNPPEFSPDGKWLALLGAHPSPPDGKWLALPTNGREVVFDASSLEVAASVIGEIVSFSPDSRQLVTLVQGDVPELRVWIVGSSSNRATIHLDPGIASKFLGTPQLSADGTMLALQIVNPLNGEARIGLFDAATGEEILFLDDMWGAGPGHYCFLPDGRTWACVRGSEIRFRDLHFRTNSHSLDCSALVFSFAVSSDGNILAASHEAGLISLWNLKSGARLGSLAGHQDSVFSLAFSPDGRTLASGSEDRTIRLWHLATQRELASFTQEQGVYWLAFSPDNQMLVSGGIGFYQAWRAPRGDAVVTTIAPQRSLADLPTNSIWRIPDGANQLPTRTVAEKDLCFTNLLKIHTAIMAYRKDHRQMPDGLGDLVPAYLSDTNCLICPIQARTGEEPNLFGMEDPKVTSSYLYEFNARTNVFTDPYGVASPGDTMKMWKEKQVARYGPVVPVVRCFMHAQVLSVTWAGERRVEVVQLWEMAAEQTLQQQKRLEAAKIAAVDPASYDALVGKYSYPNGQTNTVTREGSHLFAQMNDQPKLEILPTSETEFFWKDVNAQVTFVKDQTGKVTKAIHHQGGQTLEGLRIE